MTETVTIEEQVWESTLNRSMQLQAENEKLKELLKDCEKRQSRLERQLKRCYVFIDLCEQCVLPIKRIASIKKDIRFALGFDDEILDKVNQVLGEE